MTDTVEPETEQVSITFRMRQAIEHMLKNPKGQYYASGMCEELGTYTGTLSPLLHRMEQAGWLTSETGPRGMGRHQPRRYYRFTKGTAPMLRKALRD